MLWILRRLLNCWGLGATTVLLLLQPLSQSLQAKETSKAEISDYIEQINDTDDNWQQRSQAVQELSTIAQQTDWRRSEIVEVLINALEDPDSVVQLRAAIALSEIAQIDNNETVISILVDTLHESKGSKGQNLTFVLTEVGYSVLERLTKKWSQNQPNSVGQSNLVTTIESISTDLKEQSEKLSKEELNTALINLEKAIQHLPIREELTEKAITNLLPQEGVATVHIAFQSLQAEVGRRRGILIFETISTAIAALIILLLLTAWYRPQLLLKLSRSLVNLRESQTKRDRQLHQLQDFFKQADATVRRYNSRCLKVVSIVGRLKAYAPLPIMTIEQPTDQDVSELLKQSKRMASTKNNKENAGILVYRQSPDAIFRTEMAQARMRDHFVLLPIPLAAVEQALNESGAAGGLIAQYADRYLPGANLFDDRNAIGDTLSFFGRQDLLQQLKEELQRNQGIGLFGLRKSGKTSLLLQLGFAMRRNPTVHLDLQPYGARDYFGAELFNKLIQDLINQLQERNPSWKTKPELKFEAFSYNQSAVECSTEFIQRVEALAQALFQSGYERPLIFFLDEIERILPIKTDAKERAEEFNAFFGALRALSQEKRLISFLIADVHPDASRINQWSQVGVTTNPVFQFFKETFVKPFSEMETLRMVNDICNFMGIEFDSETQQAIHSESGGHPFVARQLASLLYDRIVQGDCKTVEWSVAQRYFNKPFTYSGVLKDYFAQNIWGDLEKRDFVGAMDLLRVFAARNFDAPPLSETCILKTLSDYLTKSQIADALLWLEAVGLIDQELVKLDNGQSEEHYQIRVPLLSRWLQMQMSEEERQQWQPR